MIRGAIFDADGTLLDSMSIWEDAGARYLGKLGILPEANLSEILFSMSLEEGCIYLKSQYGLSGTLEEIKAGVLCIIADFFRFEAQAKKGAAMFLRKLHEKNIPMVIATSGDANLLQESLKRLEIQAYFSHIFTCSELHTNKRESYIYEKAAECLYAEPDQIFVFEDVLYALESALRAGFKTVGVQDMVSEKDQEQIRRAADYYMEDFTDFEHFWKFASYC